MVGRISNLAQFTRVFSQVQDGQANLARLQIQVATGEKSTSYVGLASDSSRLLSSENTFKKINQYMDNIDGVRQRTDAMDNGLSSLQDVAIELKALLVTATNAGSFSQFDVAGQARDLLERATSLLNKKVDGKYLFSGSATSTLPVLQPSPLTPPSNNGGANGTFIPFDRNVITQAGNPVEYAQYFGYYQGNTDLASVRIDEDQVSQYGIQAGEDPFVEMIYALRLAGTIDDATVTSSGEELSRLNNALTMVNQGIVDIANRQSQLGQKLKSMDVTFDAHADTTLRLEDIIVGIEATDIPQAVAKLTEFETQLQASYMVVTRLQNISLLNFLR